MICTACDAEIAPGFGAVITSGRVNGFEMYAVTHYTTECVRVVTSDDDDILGTV